MCYSSLRDVLEGMLKRAKRQLKVKASTTVGRKLPAVSITEQTSSVRALHFLRDPLYGTPTQTPSNHALSIPGPLLGMGS